MNRHALYCRELNYRDQAIAIWIVWAVMAIAAFMLSGPFICVAFTAMSAALFLEYVMCIVSIRICDSVLENGKHPTAILKALKCITIFRNVLFMFEVTAFCAGIISNI